MKLFTGWVISAGLVLTASGAHAQMQPLHDLINLPATVVSDFGGPYAAMPPDAPVPGYGPSLLPPTEVYTVVRENGFSPLGIPRQRGLVYTISVVDRAGDNGRLVIDARTGRIIRFMPAYRMGDNSYNDDPAVIYAPPVRAVRGPPRPPAPIPRVASRTPSVPTPKPSPHAVGEPKAAPIAATPAPAPAPVQQSAAVQPVPAAAPVAAPAPVEAKPPVQIQPTQEMPKAQGLD
jgi:hypothetical protein